MIPNSSTSLCAAIFEPLGGVFIGTGDSAKLKPALFVVSCGEGHLDLRTADKVHMLRKSPINIHVHVYDCIYDVYMYTRYMYMYI